MGSELLEQLGEPVGERWHPAQQQVPILSIRQVLVRQVGARDDHIVVEERELHMVHAEYLMRDAIRGN